MQTPFVTTGHVGQQIEEVSQAMPSLRTSSVENMLNITRQSQRSQVRALFRILLGTCDSLLTPR